MLLPLSRLALLLFAASATGCVLVGCLSGLSWRSPEGLGLGVTAGLCANATVLFAADLAGVRLGYLLNVALLAAGALVLSIVSRFGAGARNAQSNPRGTTWGLAGSRPLPLMIVGALALVIAFFAWRALLDTIAYPFHISDEFHFWGVAAKSIFLRHTADLRGSVIVDFRRVPPLVPLNAASIAYALGAFAENYVKLASTLLLLPLLSMLYGMARRLALNAVEAMLFLVMLVTAGNVFSEELIVLYSDFTFMVLYAAGTFAYLLSSATSRPRGTLLLSGLLLGAAAFTRADGLLLVLATFAVLAVTDGRVPVESFRRMWPMALAACALPLAWQVYQVIHPWPEGAPALVGLTRDSSPWLSFLVRLRESTLAMIKQTISLGNWSGIWLLTGAAAVVAVRRLWHSSTVRTLIALIATTIGFYWVVYLFVFSYGEAVRAASFERYLSHVLPQALLLLMIVYVWFRDRSARGARRLQDTLEFRP